ncbi:MAG: SDR family NAD(P)-dependent oxidoreductase [bacterium]|nr:SDR family NAD(P)-dependent oxidoreductase [bacterium]
MALRVVVITGATGGIGSATARRFAKDNELLVLVDHPSREKQLKEFVSELDTAMNKGGYVTWYTNDVDVMNFRSVDECYRQIEECAKLLAQRFGRIDVLVNVAGKVFSLTPLVKTKPEDIVRSIMVNQVGPIFWCKAVLPHMREHGYGRIVSVASVMGEKGDQGNLPYASAKAGVMSMTRTLAVEAPYPNKGSDAPLAITVNAVMPGVIDTDMAKEVPEKFLQEYLKRVPFARKGKPEEVADLIHFLASDVPAMRFLTGESVAIDGGYRYRS